MKLTSNSLNILANMNEQFVQLNIQVSQQVSGEAADFVSASSAV